MLIETTRDLLIECEAWKKAPALYIDTEFVGESRYYPDLGAIQVATTDSACIVDPIAIQDLSPLFEVLADTRIVKVFHAVSQDLAIFYRLMGQAMHPIFDTQIAASVISLS